MTAHKLNKMKKPILTLLVALSLFSCKKEEAKGGFVPEEKTDYVFVTEGEGAVKLSPEETGKAIFEGKGNCYSCHRAEEQSIGPSIKDISKIYQEKKGNIVSFLKEESKPIVDPEKYSLMKANFYITKTFTDEELKAVEAYIYSY